MTTIKILDEYRFECIEFYPIARGVYCGHDVLYLENNLCGKYLVRRHKMNGELIEDFGKFDTYEDAKEMIAQLKIEQGRKDCAAVTGNGRYSA